MVSSVYAMGSALAKTLKASRMGRYPVQRLHRTTPLRSGRPMNHTGHRLQISSPEISGQGFLDLELRGRLWFGAQQGVH